MSKTPPPSLESAYHDYSLSHVLYTGFLKISKKGLQHMLPGPIYSSQVCEFTRYSSSSIKNRLSSTFK